LTYAAVSIGLAAAGFGVYSLVIANYASLGAWLIGTWSLAHWRPGRGRPSVRLWRKLARFAFPLFVQGVVEQVREAAEAALLGRRLGEAPLGQYRYGKRLMLIPALAVLEVGSYLLFPAFSRLAGDAERLKAGFLRALRWIWITSAPGTALIIALGEPAVVVLLGERWRGAGVFLVATAGYGLGMAVQAAANEGIKACGRPRLLHWTSAMQLFLGIGLVVVLLPFGLLGVGLAISATQLLISVVMLGQARTLIRFSLADLVRTMVPSGVATLAAFAGIWPLEHVVVRSDEHGFAAGLGLLALDTLLFVALYLAALYVLDRRTVVDLANGARRVIAQLRRGRSADPASRARGGAHRSEGAVVNGARPHSEPPVGQSSTRSTSSGEKRDG
jgi:PST family polysaccharide transporter